MPALLSNLCKMIIPIIGNIAISTNANLKSDTLGVSMFPLCIKLTKVNVNDPIAIPNAILNCIAVPLTEDAELIFSLGISARESVLIDVNCKDLVKPPQKRITTINHICIFSLIQALNKNVTTIIAPLTIMTNLKPYLFKSGVVTVFMAKLPKKILSTIKPALNGSIPNPICKNSGIKNGTVAIAIRKNKPAQSVVVNVGIFKSDRSIIG